MSEDRRRAVELTVEALRRVLDPAAVAAMRDDSPLAGLGLEDADLVCVAEAIAERSGGTVLLDDADVVDLVTVADLVGAVRAATARVNRVMTSDVAELVAQLSTEIDPDLLMLALTHRSYAYENGGLPTNERLEFLGDSVLGVVITETLYRRYPDEPEGQLAKLRAAVVNASALADVARTLGLGEYVRLGRGEETTGGRDKSSILADTMEAMVGATFMSSGVEVAAELVHRLFDPLIANAAELGAGLDWKTSLQEIAAAADLGLPEYHVTDEGPDHAKEFFARAVIGGEVLGEGTGRSKKVAEQRAAAEAYERVRAVHAVQT